MRWADVTRVKGDNRKFTPDDKFVLPTCRIGLELEIENVPPADPPAEVNKYWSVKRDGSLRNNGMEYVTPDPVFGKDLREAVENLCKYITPHTKHGFFQKSERTSLHVHMDVRDIETTRQFFSFVALYMSLERTLFRYFNDEREGNIFCMPLYRTRDIVSRLYHLVVDYKDPEELRNRLIGRERNLDSLQKYSAFNIVPAFGQGSVEFRHAPAMTEPEPIFEWINILMSIKKAATERDFLEDNVANDFSDRGPEQVLYEVMGPELAQKLIGPSLHYDVLSGIRLCQQMLYMKDSMKCREELKNTIRMVSSLKGINGDSPINPAYRFIG